MGSHLLKGRPRPDRTEGNPYFVGELVRLLDAERRLDAGGLEGAASPRGSGT